MLREYQPKPRDPLERDPGGFAMMNGGGLAALEKSLGVVPIDSDQSIEQGAKIVPFSHKW